MATLPHNAQVTLAIPLFLQCSKFSPTLGPLQASLVAQWVKNLTAMWDTWVCYLGQEDPLEKGRLPTPVFWSGEFHGLYSPWGRKESDTTEQLSLSLFKLTKYYLLYVSEAAQPHQYSKKEKTWETISICQNKSFKK